MPEYGTIMATWNGESFKGDSAPAGTVYEIGNIPAVQHFERDQPVIFRDAYNDARVGDALRSSAGDRPAASTGGRAR